MEQSKTRLSKVASYLFDASYLIFIFLVVCVAVMYVTTIVDYCSLKCLDDHTMCRFPYSKPSTKCGTVKRSGLTHGEMRFILLEHNRLRQHVASGNEKRAITPLPPAKSMPMMVWDDEVTMIAQRWADQCVFNHDKCRSTAKTADVGQNLAIGGAINTEMKISHLYRGWYNEVEKVSSAVLASFGDGASAEEIASYGHFTQMMWANSTKLGCGGIIYTQDDRYTKYYLVCNYEPAGNYRSAPVYEFA